MRSCTFFGHRVCPVGIRPLPYEQIEHLIVNYNVTMFYVGNQGHFDTLVRSVLKEMAAKYPSIGYAVVLAYLPKENSETSDYSDLMLPEGVENVSPRYAIAWRNDWMLNRSEYVVAYITHDWGSALKYAAKAQKEQKQIFFL